NCRAPLRKRAVSTSVLESSSCERAFEVVFVFMAYPDSSLLLIISCRKQSTGYAILLPTSYTRNDYISCRYHLELARLYSYHGHHGILLQRYERTRLFRPLDCSHGT